MRDINAVPFRCHSGQRRHFVDGCVSGRHVLHSRCQTKGSLLHGLSDEQFHLLQLIVSGLPVVQTHHRLSRPVKPGKISDIWRHPQAGGVLLERPGQIMAVEAISNGGHALAQKVFSLRVFVNIGNMGVHVNKARGDYQARCVYEHITLLRG